MHFNIISWHALINALSHHCFTCIMEQSNSPWDQILFTKANVGVAQLCKMSHHGLYTLMLYAYWLLSHCLL